MAMEDTGDARLVVFMTNIGASLLTFTLVCAGGVRVDAIQVDGAQDQKSYAEALTSGTLGERYAALDKVIAIPPQARQDVLWMAVADELERTSADIHRYTDELLSGKATEPISSDYGEHLYRLARVVSEWHDPRALRPLVSAAGIGFNVGVAIAAVSSPCRLTVGGSLLRLRTGHAEVDIQ